MDSLKRVWLCESNTSGNFIPKFPPARAVLRLCPVSSKCLRKEQTLKINENIMKCISFEKKRPEQLRERFLERILFVSWRIFIYRAVFFKLSLQPITQPLAYLSLLSLSYSHPSIFPSPPLDYPLLY